jgi:hypothetical protein
MADMKYVVIVALCALSFYMGATYQSIQDSRQKVSEYFERQEDKAFISTIHCQVSVDGDNWEDSSIAMARRVRSGGHPVYKHMRVVLFPNDPAPTSVVMSR